MPTAHHEDAVAHAQHLGQVAGDHDDRAAGGGDGVDELVDLDAGADVDAAGRLVQQQHAGAREHPAPEDDLLLVAARQVADRLVDVAHPHPQLLGDRSRARPLPRPVDEPGAGGGPQRRVPEVLRDGRAEHEPLRLAVLRHVADPGPDRPGDVLAPQRAPLDQHGARVVRVGARDRAQQLRASRAHEARDADHLARPGLEGHVLQHARAGQAAHVEQHVVGPVVLAAAGELVGDVATHHEAHQLRLRRGRGDLVDEPPVAQHADAVADLRDLVEVVADEDHRHPGLAQLAHDAEELVDLGARQRGGGLVEDEDARVQAQGLRDLHELLARHAQLAHLVAGVDVEPDALQRTARRVAHRLPVEQAAAPGHAAQGDVLGHRHARHEVELLVDRRDPQRLRGPHVRQRHGLAVHDDPAAVRLVDARHHLDERGLPRAVLAEQHLHAPGAHVHGDVLDHRDRAERLGDALQRQQRGGGAVGALGGVGCRRVHAGLLAGPVDPRTTRWAGRTADDAGRPASRSRTASAASAPMRAGSWATTVRAGVTRENAARSS